MNLNQKPATKTSFRNSAGATQRQTEQRMLESIRRKVKAEFISAGCTQEEIDFFFAAGSDPLKVAFAIAAMQIGREERERVAEPSGDVF